MLPLDANVEGWHAILNEKFLEDCARRIEHRIEHIESEAMLDHAQQLLLTQLWQALPAAGVVATKIESALALFQQNSGGGFYDFEQYRKAVAIVEHAQAVVSAAYAPLQLSFSQYRTPFSLLGREEIIFDSAPERNPFYRYYMESLLPRLSDVSVVGISIIFPSQIQQAHSLALLIREHFPNVHLVAGGPSMTQLLLRIPEAEREAALGAFHTAILFEGERALLGLLEEHAQERPIPRIVFGEQCSSLASLPAPDYEGLPMSLYLSPELVLSYDPTRGCYWGKCAFCHYGLAEKGTAKYRERPPFEAAGHLGELSKKWKTKVFHLSQDAFAPASALRLSNELVKQNVSIRWASDVRPEAGLTDEMCSKLAAGGAMAFSFGVESASDRMLKKINKGVTASVVQSAVENASKNNIAVEAMCFTDFPEEEKDDAIATARFLIENRNKLSLFICGEFHLVSGSAVALAPSKYGIAESWSAKGDIYRTNLFFLPQKECKSEEDRSEINGHLEKASRYWRLSHYPWAGSLSTAHSLLWYYHKGIDVFRLEDQPKMDENDDGLDSLVRVSRYNIPEVAASVLELEGEIWGYLVHEMRNVSRPMYQKLAARMPTAKAKKTVVSVTGDGEFARVKKYK